MYRAGSLAVGRPEKQIATIFSGITDPEIYLDY
ncbi:hypothetical protein HDA40_007295 [Hamadaea flava]|nr:hypothetical protein [Hamadaea flava]